MRDEEKVWAAPHMAARASAHQDLFIFLRAAQAAIAKAERADEDDEEDDEENPLLLPLLAAHLTDSILNLALVRRDEKRGRN